MVAQSRVGVQVVVKFLRRDKILAAAVNIVELPSDVDDAQPRSVFKAGIRGKCPVRHGCSRRYSRCR